MNITVTGGSGFLGRYVAEEMFRRGHEVKALGGPKRADLKDLSQANEEIRGADVVVHVAAYVGGIGLNAASPGQMFYDNMQMGMNVLESARFQAVRRVVIIGTACEYPDEVEVPTPESALWDGYPTEVTAPYAMAKKALLVMGQAYEKQYGLDVEHVIPSNLYGPRDHFDTQTGHVIPSIIAKFSAAQAAHETEVRLWGTGTASRDFLHVTDAARGIADVAEIGTSDGKPINLGSRRETTIAEVAMLVSKSYPGITPVFTGEVSDGAQRRLLDTRRAWEDLHWEPKVGFEEGLLGTIAWYEDHD